MSESVAWTSKQRIVNVLAVTLMVMTLPLLFLGGLVTSHEVGMAVPDWPTTFEENMFTYNFLDKSFGIKLEHTHRLAGSVIGVITVALSIAIFRYEKRSWVRWLGLATLIGVIAQGVLGGGRVVFNALLGQHLAALHGCIAQAFFALTVIMATITSKWWFDTKPLAHEEGSTVRSISMVLALAFYAQMVLGAIVRHYQGSLWIVHLLVGGLLFFASLWLVMLVVLHRPLRERMGSAVLVLGGGLVAQITLGVVALFLTGILDTEVHGVITSQEALTVTTHLALGSVLFGVSVYLAAASRRLFLKESPAEATKPKSVLEPVA